MKPRHIENVRNISEVGHRCAEIDLYKIELVALAVVAAAVWFVASLAASKAMELPRPVTITFHPIIIYTLRGITCRRTWIFLNAIAVTN